MRVFANKLTVGKDWIWRAMHGRSVSKMLENKVFEVGLYIRPRNGKNLELL